MELKKYQKRVIADLNDYLSCLADTNSLSAAFAAYWAERQVNVGCDGVLSYQNLIEGVPHVCYKVPTGGGKTLLACASVKPIFSVMPPKRSRAVVWLVPSDSILTQTLAALKDTSHPYRQKLNIDFGGRVEVYSKEELLSGQNFSPTTVAEQLSVMVLSYDSFRSSNKEGRKAYQANGALEPFRTALGSPDSPIDEADATALFQVINQLNPVVIVDESHHARSALSLEMLKNFNPAFVLDLTATPRQDSNIISYVDALTLKSENMVKLPVIVYNRSDQKEVIADAIDLRRCLEQAAKAEQESDGDYIRPIVLFQAQPKNKEDATSFEVLKEKLIEAGIPAEQIAIKTASVDELKSVNLLDSACPIRFIITVNALKEGWDCPFAYILASLANKTSRVDVEQILGRVLRQPGVRKHGQRLLNMSYVLASSANFQQTVDDVVAGLNAAGFTANDYRVAEELPDPEDSSEDQDNKASGTEKSDESTTEDPSEEFLNFVASEVADKTSKSSQDPTDRPEVNEMAKKAETVGKEYEEEVESKTNNSENDLPLEISKRIDKFKMNSAFAEQALALRLPQFFLRESGSLFDADDEDASWSFLTKENLSGGFVLRGRDYSIDVGNVTEAMVAVDVNKTTKDTPKILSLNSRKQQEIRKYFESLPDESRLNQCVEMIFARLDRNDAIASSDLRRYVIDVIHNLNKPELKVVETAPNRTAETIKSKIEGFLAAHRSSVFARGIDTEEIVLRDSYELPAYISPVSYSANNDLSLYEVEGDMNFEERDLAWKIAGTDSVLWWHKIIERGPGEFFINGAINHYPDFMVATKRGKIVLVESKGKMLKNDDSRVKLDLGKKWAAVAGNKFRYYMVFQDGVQPLEGACNVSDFLEALERL